jgi:hypothetical protein
MNFFKCFEIITDGNVVGKFVGKSVGNKKYYYRRVFSVSKSVGNNIFLLPTEKKITDERFTDRAFLSVILLIN